jgi:glucose-6-phosphate isomerase
MTDSLIDTPVRFDPETGRVDGAPMLERRLSDLDGCFADEAAYAAVRAEGDPIVYTVASHTPDEGSGALHYGIGTLMPGRVGQEYYLTKGHLHTWRAAAELYVGLRGEGMMLLEDEATGATRAVPLRPDATVYVPGHTAHRTVNTGDVPLVYMGVYPAEAGHDYGFVATRNFRHVVVERDGAPAVVERDAFLADIA